MSTLNETQKNDRRDASALDELVLGVLTQEPRAFESVVIASGNSDKSAVRQALLRLMDAGKAELSYGLGWRLAEVKP